jgi:hypothetical protein
MSGAYDIDTDEAVVMVGLRNRADKATFVVECTVHHRGDAVVHVAFPEYWRQQVRHAGVDPYLPIGERWLWLAVYWKFVGSRVKHARDCTQAKCRRTYREANPTFRCDGCKQIFGYCMGAADEHGDLCDWCAVKAIAELDRLEAELARANAELLGETVAA